MYVARDIPGSIPVFVKFVSPLSALRVSSIVSDQRSWCLADECFHKAVNALEGRIFNGNAIVARFFDLEKFEKGIYVD